MPTDPLVQAVESVIADLSDLANGYTPWLDRSDAIRITERLRQAMKELSHAN